MNGFNLNESELLTKYRRAKDLEIERLLRQYGTSLEDVREMYPYLTESISQRQRTTTFPTQPIFFTASEAAQMGLSLQEGWMLKMSPFNGGYKSSLVTPQKWEITEDDLYISPEGKEYSQADIAALLSMPTGLGDWVPTERPLTVEDLTEEGRELYREYQLAGGELGIADWLNLREQQQLETEEVFGKVFPEQDISEILTYMQEQPEAFLEDIREIGPTEDMVAFLKTIEFTDEDIQELFGTTPVPESVKLAPSIQRFQDEFYAALARGDLEPRVPEIPTEAVYEAENWFKDNVIDAIYPRAVEFRDYILMMLTSIVPSLLAQIKPPDSVKSTLGYIHPFGTAAQLIAWNIGDKERTPEQQARYDEIQQSALGYFRFYDQKIRGFQQSHPELLPKPEYLENPFDKPSLFLDPGYWTYSFFSSLTYTLATMSTIIVGSVVGTPALGIPAGMAVAGGGEAGDMLSELMSMGVPFEDAVRWSSLYALFAGGIEVASDLPFLGIIFKPMQGAVKPLLNTLKKTFTNMILRRFAAGVALSFTEGIEEGLTTISHNAIIKYYDDTQSIWEGVSHAFAQGMIASAPFAGIGGHASFRTFRDTLSPEVGEQFDLYVEEFKKAGLDEWQAQIQAANQIARTDEGQAELAKAIEAAQEEYWAEHGPAPQPVIPEMADYVLQDIEVLEQITKRGLPTIPEAEAVKPAAIPTAEAGTPEAYETADEFIKSRIVSGRGFAPSGFPETLASFSEIKKPDTPVIFSFIDTKGNSIEVYEREGEIIAFHGEQAVAKIGFPREQGFGIDVVKEYWNQGIGTKLLDYFLRKYPWRKTTGFTRAGEALMRKVYRESKTIPKTAIGMPEAGLQPSMLEEVPAKEIRPEARGKLVQSRLDDYLRLREYNKQAVIDRIAEIKKALETKGRLPKELGLKGNLRIELARLEALQELDAVETVEEIDHLIKQVSEELGNRSLPYQGLGGKAHIDLLRHPSRRLFKGYTTKQLEEMLNVYQQARRTLSPDIPATSVIKAGDIPTDIPALTNTELSPKQVEKTIDLFKEAVAAPDTETQRAAALELRKHVFAQRAKSASESAEAMIAEGMNPEEAIKAAEQQFMSGKLPDVTTDYFNDLTQEMRNVLFAKVYNYWKDKSWTELISTHEALTNALAGKSIPRVKGIGTKYFPDGGSAWDRLARVFVGDMEVLEALDQGKSLSTIIEGIYLETGRGSVPLNEATVSWLKSLSEISEEDRLLLEKPLSEITEAEVRRISQKWFYERRNELNNLLKDGVISEQEYKLELAIAKDRVFPYKPVEPTVTYPGVSYGQPRLGEKYVPPAPIEETRGEAELRLKREAMEAEARLAEAKLKRGEFQPVIIDPVLQNGVFEQMPLFTLREKQTISRVLKGLGWAVTDINNLIRGVMASFDASFPRQGKYLMQGHPVIGYKMAIAAWKARNVAEAEAIQERIMQDPLMELYEDIRKEYGYDFLRVMGVKKGTEQWRAEEQYGYPTSERLIPRIGQKITAPFERIFDTPLNVGSWQLYKDKYRAVMRRAEKVASGKAKLKEGESVDIRQEMATYQMQIGNMVQRASLGQYNKLGPILNTIFFAARSKLGRFFFPLGLTGIYRRGGEWHFSRGLMKETWRDFMITNAEIAGVVIFGGAMGWWDYEKDPRNAEFMSIRIGNMRIDPWAGYRQFLVLYTRLATGTGVSSVTGAEYEADPIRALTTFLRGSLAPVPSILWDFWTGRNFLGVAVELTNAEQWFQRIAPFAVQDIWEAFDEGTKEGMIAIIPAIFGEGVQTYTGDWKDNWQKLGLPKYPENTGYGIDEPVYDISDFWADTASSFRGVDPSELTESKGFPEYIRSIAQALQIIEEVDSLPNKRLALINADPEEGTTFKDYYEMWQERERIVASGDEEKLKEFDADERTRNAYLGNMTQSQYSLLMQYHSLPDSQKAEFLANHAELYANPREDWLRSHTEENALLALWGKAKIYSEEALSKLDSLAKSLGIPENAMIDRDLDAVTQLRLQHKNLFDLLDVYSGLDDSIKDDEGLTAHDRAVKELYENNPDFRDDMRRIDALSEGTEDNPTPEDIVEAWVDRGRIVDEYGANSAEARLWLLDNREAHQWALDHAVLTDDGTDWNEPILRLQVQYREDFDLYEAYGDISSESYIRDDGQRADARHRLLFDDEENMTSFGKAYYTRGASSQGYSEGNWNAFVEYSALPLWGDWRERYLLEHLDFYREYTDPEIGNHPLLDASTINPLARDRIYQQFYDEFQAWDETGGMFPKEIENMRDDLDAIERGGMTFKEARYAVGAYDQGIPEKYIDLYVEYYQLPTAGYDQERFLMTNEDYYRDVWLGVLGNQPKDFSGIPTKEEEKLLTDYDELPTGSPRLRARCNNAELDAALVRLRGLTPAYGTDRCD